MPLSEYEQRVLEQMERQLATDDPRLANTLTQRGARRTVGRYVVAGIGAVVGLLLLVFGVAGDLVLLGVVGFVVMFAAVAFAFASPRRESGPQGTVGADGTVRTRPGNPRGARPTGRTAKPGMMARFEERWERRRGSDGH
ncbi:DUF3040 domain-containing protein [Cellulomonas sp.]|uniref:DUF3040 domain-containing protein n=1 Tax=Cellulomonas sp. TaxID=40001 RepID=UPI002590D042|nr:DUF3040 domain-containing protein [Cellulomonas sp.]MCR6689730.1 DUF3040 domain-containing protein [Cellulomonas sp.]